MKLLCTLLTILITYQYRVLCRINHFRDRKFSWNNVESEYRETIPIRVNEAGQSVYPQNKQFLSYNNRVPDSELLYYHVTAFGRTFKFKLVRDRSFVSPSLEVEHVFNDSISIPYRGGLGHCFYNGHLEEDSLSTVLFNLCNGLRGTFTTEQIEYFIDHMEEKETRNSSFSSLGGKLHVVYRRLENALNTNTSYDLGEAYFPGNTSEYVIEVNRNDMRISRKKRSKRYIEAAYVETMITADRSMVEAFRSTAELQSYLTTIMGMVARIYRDRSIGNLIKVVLVKIFMIESDLRDLQISSSATSSLTSFCKWQRKMNKRSDSHPGHYDTAILMTKTDICRAAGKCDTLGLAELSTICSTSRSCAIVEDSGLNTAFTIAHELAHVFSLSHDGDKNICTKRKGTSNIMAPSLSFDTKPWMWSPCSRKALTEFLELGLGWCLEDRPDSGRQTFYENRLPGEKYSADEQCRFIYGSESSLCPAMERCRRLWCVKQIGKQRGCQTHHMPWADGTPCAKDKWCIRGICVKQRRLQSIDGGWSQWRLFGHCTRSCGGGIQFSFRQCDSPTPKNGGLYCRGARKKFRSCNTRDCPKNSLDFRAIQCAKLNNKPVKIEGHQRNVYWVPKHSARKDEQCSLFCRVGGRAIYFRVSKKVIDGTPCNQYSSDICVDGQCRPAGCDRVVGSKARFDVCAVCKGNNSTCKAHRARYNKKTKYGYNFVYIIPAGSTNIKITQRGRKPEDDNFLALKSITTDKYLLNGGYVVGLGIREFAYNGSKVWYSGSEKKLEEIRISGKTVENITVEVLSVGNLEPPDIKYALYVPRTAAPKLTWNPNGPWTQCSRICRGRRRRQMLCIRNSDKRVVNNRKCRRYPRPAVIREPCNTNCRLRWNIKRDGHCSVRCGSGTRRQKVRCMRISGRRMQIIPDGYCKHLSRPPNSVPCKGECKNSTWVYSPWTKCSKSCGAGVQRRTANCADVGGGSLPDEDCRDSDKKPLQQPCNDQVCPTWRAGRWSACSVTCGKGVKTGQASCTNGEKVFPDSACRSDPKPPIRKSCSLDACPYWSTATDWSECSVTCGKGVQMRQVNCRNRKNVVSDSACRSQAKPSVRKSCSRGTCPYWITTGWSACSVTCGYGRKTRHVSCHYPLDNSVVRTNHCNPATKPNDQKGCFKRECPILPTTPRYRGSWSEGIWTRCSTTCDKGIKRRQVVCRDSKGVVITDANCNNEEKPTEETSCIVKPCTSWKHGEWGMCSKPCGQGVQLRIVKCAFDNWEIADDKRCNQSKRPPDYRKCKIRSCHPRPVINISQVYYTASDALDNQPTTPFSPRWEIKEWSQCSVTCGKGVRSRDVTCKLRNNQRSNLCSPLTKPQTTSVCNLGPCPKWIAQPWSQCSVSCGSGERHRRVRCNGENTKCDNETKPLETEVCNVQKCPEWIAGSWSKCSVTCGKGYQMRPVECSTKNGNCNRSNKPSQIRACEYAQCPRWRLGIWSECTVTCGKGMQKRNVTCDSKSLPCDTRHKPLERRVCNTRKCPVWRAGAWSKCSTTCDGGVRLRPVTCHPIRGQCNPQTRPIDMEECNMEECPKWITGSWDECSASCGGGVTKRIVRCNNKRIPILCDDRKKPFTTKSCNVHECPKWNFGRWSKCSVTCGRGVQTRSVTCKSKHGPCDPRIKPQRTRVCNAGRCPTWITGRWTDCSKTCGDGFQLRKVECDGVRGSCDVSQRPLFTQICNRGECPEWKVGNWSDCSVSCGEGVKSRDVMCSTGDDKCSTLPKPEGKAKCVLSKCPSWIVGLWSKCSTTCDEGLQKREVTCKPASGQCDRRIKPEDTRICNLGLCPKWDPGTWSECSVSCGEGVRRRAITCHSKLFPCNNETRPIHVERCNLGLCPKWTVGHWSICSVTCGDGTQTRDVMCNTGDDRCVAKKPLTKRSCNLRQCPKWIVGPWEYCSVTCGLGVNKRIVYCNTQDGRCDEKVKPKNSQSCKMTDCPSWSTGPWSKCSVTCGPGIRIRRVQCLSIKNKFCNVETKPSESERCDRGPCPSWVVTDWSKCSVSCGMGLQTRSVTCSDLKKDCNPSQKPSATLQCDRGECPSWIVGPWEECSTTCGDGKQRREVFCRSGGKPAPCDEDSKPIDSRKCNRMECPVWTVGLWTECSTTCGDGIRRREVICRPDKPATCDESSKPVGTEKCNLMECPIWTVGEWSECSTTCGDGLKRREVICRSRGKLATCDENTRPLNTQKCKRIECPVWTVGVWSECSATCGKAVQRRQVTCASASRRLNCDKRSKPIDVRACKLDICPSWITGNWTKCSATCGEGRSTRDVRCNTKPNKCKNENKPIHVKRCNRGTCPRWIASPWSQCSVTCGKGKMQRSVNCTIPNKCDEKNKPTTDITCNMGSCARWKIGEWSQCSVSCGRGKKSRTVRCLDGDRPSYECDIEKKPPSFSSCGSHQDCPSWSIGNWTECSRSCGVGVASRQVRCLQGESVLDYSACNANTRPVIRKACRILKCVKGAFWKRGPWGKCSVQCSEGVSTRTIRCVARNRTQIEDKYCDRRKLPNTIKSCNKYKQCGVWEVGLWSKCSTSCGDGLKTRAVRCLHNLEYTHEDNCDLSKKPIDQLFCQNNICPLSSDVYRWQTTSWSKCSRTCGYGRKARRVMCIDNRGIEVIDKYCNVKSKPDQFLPCFEVRCPPKWKFGHWSECSRTCGHGGYQVRPVTCEGVPGARGCNVRNKPPVWRPCNFGPCSGELKWKVGTWSQCSVSCGIGVMKREVSCYDKQEKRRPDSFCTLPALKPDETRSCHMRHCTPRTCREIQVTNGLQADGEHVLEIQGRLLKIYCHGMTTDSPKEYITLKSGSNDNFAEMHPKRLLNPYRCPSNRRIASCPCAPENYEESGGSYFSKIRLDITKMLIIADDIAFAVTRGLKPPPYGTAGDCYSLVNCPQGRFSINLRGTGLELSPAVRWRSSGRSSSQVIYRYPEGKQVIGKCGGHCGKCTPDERVGLKLIVSKGN